MQMKTATGKLVMASEGREASEGPRRPVVVPKKVAVEEDATSEDDDDASSEPDAMEAQSAEEEDDQVMEDTATKAASSVDLAAAQRHLVYQKKVHIAKLCEQILEDPEAAVRRNKEHPQHHS